jgi:hypothetical protein
MSHEASQNSVQFDDEQEKTVFVPATRAGSFVALVQKWGLAKDEIQARQVCCRVGIAYNGETKVAAR